MSGVAERWTTRSGPSIRYLSNDPAEPVGLPLLLSPGLSDRADEYTEALAAFLPRPALVVEVRGRGGSEAPATGYAAADHVADLRAVLEEEGIDRFHLMTFSRGTTWALGLAASVPDRVASLSIGDYAAAEVHLDEALLRSQVESRFRGVPMPERMPTRVLRAVAAESVGRALWDDLAALPCPLLVARSAAGGVLGDELEARYRAARPDVEVVTIPGEGHDLFRHDRTAYPRAVTDFLARRCPGG